MSDLTTLFAQADAIGSKYQTEAEAKAHRDRMAKVLAELDAIMDEEAAKVEQECQTDGDSSPQLNEKPLN